MGLYRARWFSWGVLQTSNAYQMSSVEGCAKGMMQQPLVGLEQSTCSASNCDTNACMALRLPQRMQRISTGAQSRMSLLPKSQTHP